MTKRSDWAAVKSSPRSGLFLFKREVFEMKNPASQPNVGAEKILPIVTLYAVSAVIIIIGTAFGIFSVVNNISIPVLTSRIPGVIFGIVMVFLGLRYLFSVRKLKAEVFKSTSSFSWSNFKKVKKSKT